VSAQTASGGNKPGDPGRRESAPVDSPDRFAASPNAPQARAEKLNEAVVSKNARIDFWGKVVDQDGHPLPGVRVVMRAREWAFDPALGPKTIPRNKEVITDNLGSFSWIAATGDSLQLESVQKEGYRLSAKAETGFVYGNAPDAASPSEQNPVIIRMWKSNLPSIF
jgi:hypothetical protein